MRFFVMIVLVIVILAFVGLVLPSISVAIQVKDVIAILAWLCAIGTVGWGFRW